MERIKILSAEHERLLLIGFLQYFIQYDRSDTISYHALRERAMDLARALELPVPEDTSASGATEEIFIDLTHTAHTGPLFPFPKGPYS